MKIGDKVKVFSTGKIEEIIYINGCMILTLESAKKGYWYHPSKIRVVI